MRDHKRETRGSDLGAERVLGLCAVCNLSMRRVLEGAGMQPFREDDEMHAHRDQHPSIA
jgi:RimJ/RimL family protein N-acetyltransferase